MTIEDALVCLYATNYRRDQGWDLEPGEEALYDAARQRIAEHHLALIEEPQLAAIEAAPAKPGPLRFADLKACRRAWKYTLEQTPKRQPTMLALWASVWAEPLMAAAADQIKRKPPDPDT